MFLCFESGDTIVWLCMFHVLRHLRSDSRGTVCDRGLAGPETILLALIRCCFDSETTTLLIILCCATCATLACLVTLCTVLQCLMIVGAVADG